MSDLSAELLLARAGGPRVAQRVDEAVAAAVAAGPLPLVRFLGRYISWNSGFGSGVASLAAKIGRSRRLFFDPHEPITACADRSVHVGSFFFDAARDEFDDRDTAHRDTHRTLAQAALKATAAFYGLSAEEVNRSLAEPLWLTSLGARTQTGYGLGAPDDHASVFRAMGFHLGSEILADTEFSNIDRHLRALRPELVAHLQATRVHLAGQEHDAWFWIGVHSGHGNAVEADHFAWAIEGVTEAFRFVPEHLRHGLTHELIGGFDQFAAIHQEFFAQVLAD
jgi:hypothetical protein